MGRVFRSAQPLLFCAATLLMLIVAGPLRAQDALSTIAPSPQRFGGPQDWSNQHVIYTRNGSIQDMLTLRDDPRFLHSALLHYMREHHNQFGQSATTGSNASSSNESSPDETSLNEAEWDESNLDDSNLNQDIPRDDQQELLPASPWKPILFPTLPPRNKHSKVDWSISLGPSGGLNFGETPAVYTYNYLSPSCSNLTATPPTVGDFAVYTINATPSTTVGASQANLVGITNLYTTGAGTGFCSGLTGPSFLFTYAIGSGGSPLSPVLSLDGSRIAWIENRTATTSYLHITIWSANDGATATDAIAPPGTLTNGACVPTGKSCDLAINYTNTSVTGCTTTHAAANGHSDLYVDYSSDAGFISANNGLLYHIKNIFSTTTNPSVDFCIPVNTTFEGTPTAAMSGPVYDPVLNEVFITDSEKIYAYNVNTTGTTIGFTPASTPSYTYGNTLSGYNYQTGPGLMLDAFNGYIYVFSTYDAAGKTSVTQIPASLASGTAVELGPETTNTNKILFYGAFDNNYYNNGPKNAASTLYSCGTDSATTTAQDLFAISFIATSGVVNTNPAMSYNKNVNPSGTTGLCSPITEFYDGTNDRIFVGMGQPTVTTGSNVVTMWNVNSRLTSASSTPTASATGYLGGASGFAADNSSADAQAESIYFSTETVGSTSTPVPATTPYNVNAIYTNGTTFAAAGGLDNDGNAYSSNALGTTVTWNGTTFTFGAANVVNGWSNTTITLPSGQYSTLTILAAAVNVTSTGIQETLTVNYSDGTSTTLTQNFSDWFNPLGFGGESIAKSMTYRDTYTGGKDQNGPFDLYGYSFAINPNKTVASLTLPATRDVVVLAAALSNNCGGADFCAVKLTQSALQ
jgi:hypothetical protein